MDECHKNLVGNNITSPKFQWYMCYKRGTYYWYHSNRKSCVHWSLEKKILPNFVSILAVINPTTCTDRAAGSVSTRYDRHLKRIAVSSSIPAAARTKPALFGTKSGGNSPAHQWMKQQLALSVCQIRSNFCSFSFFFWNKMLKLTSHVRSFHNKII